MAERSVDTRGLEDGLCYLCGRPGEVLYGDQRDRLWNVPGVWTLMRCGDCDFVWISPKPPREDVEKLYADYYTHSTGSETPGTLDFSALSLREKVKYSILRSGYKYDIPVPVPWGLCGRLLSSIPPLRVLAGRNIMYLEGDRKGRLLDVGCGNGGLLSEMRRLGWEVYGTEQDPRAAEVARGRRGLEMVSRGTLEEAGYPDDYFDVITMNHVIEHLYDPISTLRECRRVLKPSGTIVVVTPNVRGLASRVFGRSARHLEVPRHLFLFSPGSMKAVLAKSGFRLIRQRYTLENTYFWKSSYRISRGAPAAKVRVRGSERVLVALFEYLVCSLDRDLSEEILVVGGKG